MKSILVVGVGRFGKFLATELIRLGNDVVAIDKDDAKIETLDSFFTDSFVGDCRNDKVLASLGVNNYDLCFVCIGTDFQSSLEITALLKEAGAKKVISVADQERQAELLKKIGADEVILPEKASAEKAALKYNAEKIIDLIQLSSDYAIFELPVLKEWIGKKIIDVDVRKKYKVNIIAIKNNEKINASLGADYIFDENDHLLILGEQEDVFKLADK